MKDGTCTRTTEVVRLMFRASGGWTRGGESALPRVPSKAQLSWQVVQLNLLLPADMNNVHNNNTTTSLLEATSSRSRHQYARLHQGGSFAVINLGFGSSHP